MASPTVPCELEKSLPSELIEVDLSSDNDAHPPPLAPSDSSFPAHVPEAAKRFFAAVSSPTDILSSNLVSRVQGTSVIEGGYNFVHVLSLDTGESDRPSFPFVLRFPIDPDAMSRSQTRTSVGCMLYCQRRPDLNIPTPAVYAYNCTYGSEFIAMEYVDGDTLSDVWLDLSEEDKSGLVDRVVEIMRTMRTKTAFKAIGGISPDGSACPLVDGRHLASGRAVLDSFGLYNIGPYESVKEYVQSIFDRRFHYVDHMLHKGTLSAHEAEFREETSNYLSNLTPEEAFELVKSKREDFAACPYNPEYPFVLHHGDLHGRNVMVSRSSPRRILAILDWEFGGSHALPFADEGFEVSSPDTDADVDVRMQQADEVYDFQLHIDKLAGMLPHDPRLTNLVYSTDWGILDREAGPRA